MTLASSPVGPQWRRSVRPGWAPSFIVSISRRLSAAAGTAADCRSCRCSARRSRCRKASRTSPAAPSSSFAIARDDREGHPWSLAILTPSFLASTGGDLRIERIDDLRLVIEHGLAGLGVIAGGDEVPGVIPHRRAGRDLLVVDAQLDAAVLVDEEAVALAVAPFAPSAPARHASSISDGSSAWSARSSTAG